MTRYAPGRKAWGECARSGRRMLLKDMTFDGRFPNLRVDPAWFEDKHPQENLPKVSDAIALHRPAPQRLPQPSAPLLVATVGDGPSIELAWSESISMVELIESYIVFRAVGEGEFEELATIHVERDAFAAVTSENGFTDEAVEQDTTYRYYVIARTMKSAESPPSNVLEVEIPAPSPPRVALSDHVIVGSDNSQFFAGVRLRSTGELDLVTTVNHAADYAPVTGEWLLFGEGSEFEVRLTVLSGSQPFGTGTESPNQWLSLDEHRVFWMSSFVSAPVTEVGEWFLEIRDAVTEEVLASCTLDVTAIASA